MPNFSGAYSTKLGSQTMMSVSDRTDHLIGVSVVSATQKSPDANWNGAKVFDNLYEYFRKRRD